jgi:hypothetical protein
VDRRPFGQWMSGSREAGQWEEHTGFSLQGIILNLQINNKFLVDNSQKK